MSKFKFQQYKMENSQSHLVDLSKINPAKIPNDRELEGEINKITEILKDTSKL